MVRILVLSFYYAPDLSAGSFRTTALVKALIKNTTNIHIDVITTLPNRYSTFNTESQEHEQKDGVDIYRIKLPLHQSGMRDQSKAFIRYFKSVNSLVSDHEYDLVYATSSRLMTAVLGSWIAKRKKARLYLDIRDIFVDTIKDVLPRKVTFLIMPIFSFLERWSINKADKVNLVSEGFRDYFEFRYPEQNFTYFTNGIDDEFLNATKNIQEKLPNNPIKVLYAGNMGEGQGLHMIIPKLAHKMLERIHFILIGDGGRKSILQSTLNKEGCTNVELRQPINRVELIKAYLEADVLFLHLNDYAAFKNVLPSKLFEYAALGKPIWAGVSGYAAEFTKSEIPNAAVFYPCNIAEAAEVFQSLELKNTERSQFKIKFSRKNIMKFMADDVLLTIGDKNSL